MDVKKDKLMLLINTRGGVDVRNHQGVLMMILYSGGDAQRADWLDEKNMWIWVQTTNGKIKHINRQGVVMRTIG